MRIAILNEGQPTYNKGIACYVQEKCRCMLEKQDDTLMVDCFMLRYDYLPLMRWFINRKSKQNLPVWKKHEEQCTVNAVTYHCLWRNYGMLDNILYSKLGIRLKEEVFMRSIAKRLKGYDIICTHKTPCHKIGRYMKKHYGIPYIATWHGSDINIYPNNNKMVHEDTIAVIEDASLNLFVSKGLMQASYKLTQNGTCDVIYTGAAKHFKRYSREERLELRNLNRVVDYKVVGFVGNLVSVKNVMVLPDIFKRVSEHYTQQKLAFWIIGNGELEGELRIAFEEKGVDVYFFGRRDSFDMPFFYNSMDILILPSIAEGLGLVALEARTCGVNVVGSNVGGIPEAIGQPENCFELDDKFVESISKRIVEILNNNESPKSLKKEMSWDYAIEKELAICRTLVKERNRRITSQVALNSR